MKYLITFSYDGSKFFGFRRLKNKSTVQGELEKALSIINKKPVEIKGAGRTDRGVHAYEQCAHFELEINIPTNRLIDAINSLISDYVRVKTCEIVNNDFHARFDVKFKIYKYKINLGEYDPFLQDYTLQGVGELDIKKMKIAAKAMIGGHNFKLFTSGKRDNYNTIIEEISFKKEGDILEIIFKGKSFYRYMVRNLVGALIEVGKNKISPKLISKMLSESHLNKQLSTADSKGLYLIQIRY